MYGFEVSNNLGELVISSETEVYQFSKSITIGNAGFREGTYVFDVPRDSPDDLHFFLLPSGSRIGYGKYAPFSQPFGSSFDPMRSNMSQLTVRVFTPISKLQNPSGSGYGMEVYNSSGDLTFTASREMLACDSGVVLANGSQTTIGDAEYFSPGMPVLYQFESGGVYANVVNLFHRDTATTVKQTSLTTETGPFPLTFPFTTPWPVGCLWF